MMATPYKQRSDLHLFRKIWHCGAVLVLYFIWTCFQYPQNRNILFTLGVIFVIGDLLRVKVPTCNRIFNNLFKIVLRKSEANNFAGTTYLLTGVAIIVSIFSHSVVALSILFVAFADPIASYFGIKYGRTKIMGGSKSLEGFLAGFVVCAMLTFGFISSYNLPMTLWVLIALAAGLIGALAELVPVGSVDDNFTMPIISAIGLHFLFTLSALLP